VWLDPVFSEEQLFRSGNVGGCREQKSSESAKTQQFLDYYYLVTAVATLKTKMTT